ncbi:MAG: OmpA family protein [Bacteroidetes bacterium]|nr:OmpA family protein [Bacteroidota bacterium]
MRIIQLTFAALLFTSIFGSCVAKKKFLEATSTINALRQDSLRLENDLAATNNYLKDSRNQNADLQKRYDDLTNAAQQKEQALSSTKEALSSTQEMLNSAKEKLTNSSLTIEEQQKRLEALQQLIDKQRAVVENLHKTIDDALGQYKAEDLDVYVKNGKVYVSLQEKLLFKSGSAVVGKEGIEALGKIANVLNSDPKIQILVEGHTDSIPIRRTFEDNWALSVARAVSIVRILTKDYNVDPARVIASGHSYFDPRDTNSTAEGRALNRRTEIILSPNLDELYRLMQ